MDFAALPPEINSARMYTGAGAAPMMAAASTWSGLGAELNSTAAGYQSVITALTGEEWRGPAAQAMATAVAPYVQWLNTTAAAAEQAAAQAMASAAAYETAFAATVPPPLITANRSQLMALTATNVLGQNTAAIAATEAHYGEMWAQDALAMYEYAATSANAGTLNPLDAPEPIADPAGLAAGAAPLASTSTSGSSSGLSQLVSGLPTAVQQLSSPLSGNGFLADVINSTQNIGLWNTIQTYGAAAGNIGAWNMFGGISAGVGLASAHGSMAAPPAAAAAGAEGAALVNTTAPAGPLSGASTPVSAGMGKAAPVGALSAPASWPAATPASNTATLAGTGWTAAAEEGAEVAVTPAGMPAMASAGRGGFGFGTPRYGVKPTVMPRSLVVG